MTRKQLNDIIKNQAVPYPAESITLLETHISWVLLADTYVYKIKKPLLLNFLDFSTMEKRKYYCEREVALNRRLAPSMYLDVLPIKVSKGEAGIALQEGEIIDYAVLMKRMDESRQLDLLLEQGTVPEKSIIQLADVIAAFHQKAEVVPEGADWKVLYEEFADILSVRPFLETHFGKDSGTLLAESTRWAFHFLRHNRKRIAERNAGGFNIDGHGDLHARNIFLTEVPVIFDCIEFNDAFRKLDMLSEIAFLCMDLERFDRYDLSAAFSKRYFAKVACLETPADASLFQFYKLYRSNVRVKVHALRAHQEEDRHEDSLQNELGLIAQYLALYKQYFQKV